MALPYYQAMRKTFPSSPNEYYRSHFQALINDKWEETTTKYIIQAETAVGAFEFSPVEVRVEHALDKSTGIKQGDDFRELVFKEITHCAPKGLYYQFDDSYWLTINTDEYNRTSKNIIIRRCNNFLRYFDKNDGALVEIPCILEYDASSPSPQVDNDVITPNNHMVIIIQGNAKTLDVVQANMRFIFGGRPFKVTGYNNYMQNGIVDTDTPMVYIDAYLDEISPYDDLKNQIAYNYGNDYKIEINQSGFQQVKGYSTQLTATVTNKNMIVTREIVWYTNNENIATIDSQGVLTLLGEPNETVEVVAQLGNNRNVTSRIQVTIQDPLEQRPSIVVEPYFNEVSQNDTVTFSANVYINNIVQSDTVDVVPTGAFPGAYTLVKTGANTFSLTCNKVAKMPLLLTFISSDTTKAMAVNLVSMF